MRTKTFTQTSRFHFFKTCWKTWRRNRETALQGDHENCGINNERCRQAAPTNQTLWCMITWDCSSVFWVFNLAIWGRKINVLLWKQILRNFAIKIFLHCTYLLQCQVVTRIGLKVACVTNKLLFAVLMVYIEWSSIASISPLFIRNDSLTLLML